jgi:hypothetical protein
VQWRRHRAKREREQRQPDTRDHEPRYPGVPEGSGKEFARGESHAADVTPDRVDGLGKGFAHGEASPQTEAQADHGVPEGSGKQFARGEARIVWDDDRVGDLSKGFAKGQARLSAAEDPAEGPLH